MDTNVQAGAGGGEPVSDVIERVVELRADRARVWRALTDHREFGAWFKVALDGPFVVGQRTTGHITYPGYEHLPWASETVALDEPDYFAFRWPQFDHDAQREAVGEPWTLVEFRLAELPGGGTRLTIRESGFDALSEPLRTRSFMSNSGGWTEQARNIAAHVDG